jgi:hypothetical protein
MPSGVFPTVILLPGVLVAVSIGVTVSDPPAGDPPLVTYAVVPSGETAMPSGKSPTLTGVPGALVAVLIGVTVPSVPVPLSPLAT